MINNEEILTSIKGYLLELNDLGYTTEVLYYNDGYYEINKISNVVFVVKIYKSDGFKLLDVKEDMVFILDYMKRYSFTTFHESPFTHVSKDWNGVRKHINVLPSMEDNISEITIKFINAFGIY